jgi:hypothetical protein
VGYNVYRAKAGAAEAKRLNAEPIAEPCFNDVDTTDGTEYAYAVRAVGRRGTEGERSASVPATAKAEGKEAVFVAAFDQGADAVLPGGAAARGTLQGKAGVAGGVLDLRQGGHATFEKRPEFDLSKVGRISIECWVAIGQETQMPIVVSCGLWQKAGWFLQRFGGGWRWHVGGIDCDGGKPVAGGWTHLAATFDGHKARLFQDGALVAEKSGEAVRAPWDSPLHVGQYSGGVAPSFQLNGQIAGLKIYNRALSAEEVKAASAAKPRAKP